VAIIIRRTNGPQKPSQSLCIKVQVKIAPFSTRRAGLTGALWRLRKKENEMEDELILAVVCEHSVPAGEA
jgi:hypothetical protein